MQPPNQGMCRRSSPKPLARRSDGRTERGPQVSDRHRTEATPKFGDVPDMTREEHKRRGDAADALFREMKRQIAEKLREDQ